MKTRVMVGMSGGVDSSVAALLLQRQGYEVIGATMKLFDNEDLQGPRTGVAECASASSSRDTLCCSWEAVERARYVCEIIGIRHYVLNVTREFRRDVIDQFVEEYLHGRTPNPCLRCNQLIKWGEMLRRARGLDCQYIATGHYASVEPGDNGRLWLKRGADRRKDQSYALYMLTQEELAHTLLPLGEFHKVQVRHIAAEAGLPSAETKESQDICFVPDGNYRALFGENVMRKGPIVNLKGEVLGEHEGLAGYTVGQRKGLGIAAGQPVYVVRKDVARNELVVGTRQEAVKRELSVGETNWVAIAEPAIGAITEAEIEIRYRTSPVRGTVKVLAQGRAAVALGETQQIAAPGQSAVFYRGETVLGGGVIEG